jgi:hypothetical protein
MRSIVKMVKYADNVLNIRVPMQEIPTRLPKLSRSCAFPIVLVVKVALRQIQERRETRKPICKPRGSFKEHSIHPKDST